jgi:Rab proteins geranylgeranyltransferase component A
LSRSEKKVLQIDKNNYYGGSEAAFSLQEAEEWVNQVNQQRSSGHFSDASISRLDASTNGPKLSLSRAYSLALAPQIIYNQSRLLSYLISSRSDRSLEFLAMGSWWVYSNTSRNGKSGAEKPSPDQLQEQEQEKSGSFLRIPTNREDVAFSNTGVDIRGKRALMRVLRFVIDYENQKEVWEPYSERPLTDLLAEQFKLPSSLHDLFLALTVARDQTFAYTSFALPRIALHLRSIGRFGPGFSSIIPKWGGISEIAQNACRACAVGGGVYVLGKGLASVEPALGDTDISSTAAQLSGGETVKTRWIVGCKEDVVTEKEPYPSVVDSTPQAKTALPESAARSISVVSSGLDSLFPPTAEGSFPPAGAIVVFPAGTLPIPEGLNAEPATLPPAYLMIHNGDTGECPNGQSKSSPSPKANEPTDWYDDQTNQHLSTLSATSLMKIIP